MSRHFPFKIVSGLAILVALSLCALAEVPRAAISYSRDVRPILSENCFKCHGADDKARKGKLRLDDPETAFKAGKSGAIPIVPGKPDQSELLKRIATSDEDEVMPPPSTKKTLTAAQKQILSDWIKAGAKYEAHWAFVAPKQAPIPKVKNSRWAKNPIDAFVLAHLQSEGLKPSATADPYTLVRRVYLDLVGLPPTPEEADAFVHSKSPTAYEDMVDHLLSSPSYGERWARRWLDLARYADTNGYEKDRARSIWPYRDWVIKALNSDMGFDQFTIRQLAGDLLPGATLDDRIATGFHRNTMINEEGGTDPLEYRYYSIVDRVNTTGITWLGLTVGCAQCHTHKYDPILHQDYYQMMAFLNNADEPKVPIPDKQLEAKRDELRSKIQILEEELPLKFHIDLTTWETPIAVATSAQGAKMEMLPDSSWRLESKDKDTLRFVINVPAAQEIRSLRLEALADETLTNKTVGHGNKGNFVVTDIKAILTLPGADSKAVTLKLANAKADYSQDGHQVEKAIDSDAATGWAVASQESKNHWATFDFEAPVQLPAGAAVEVVVDEQYGGNHVIAKPRLSFAVTIPDPRPMAERRKEALEKNYAKWLEEKSSKAVHWTSLKPLEATSNEPVLTILDNNSILASGDQTKSDTYTVNFGPMPHRVTAVRLEALNHESLPRKGPGRVYYEGTEGDFFVSEFAMTAGGKPIKFSKASADLTASDNMTADKTLDNDPVTGWSPGGGGVGKPHQAVFVLEQPLEKGESAELKMLLERYYASGLGCFRISVTEDNRPAEALGLPAEIEVIAAKPAAARSASESDQIYKHFLSMTPELADGRKEIKEVRESVPSDPTTMVLVERDPAHPRKTHLHHRGEFLQTREHVSANVPAFLPQLPKESPRNRLGLAQWLVSKENPLTARVIVNRQWQAFFGRGIVRTLEDFGLQGAAPSNQELLDWMAVEFMNKGWSLKSLHRLIVTSAAYRQSSALRPDLAERDPQNILLARGPRFRVEAEILRDAALKTSGLLSSKIGGPSVFPPQPASVSTEGAYGPLTWTASSGEDRYRRSLYTYAKRTAPFAMFNTFDAPAGEACIARREVSNTPLQSLALLNDVMMVEIAQAFGKQTAAEAGNSQEKARNLFRRCLIRPPSKEELTMLTDFYSKQRGRIDAKDLEAAKLSGVKEGDTSEAAAWTTVARAIMNFDEMLTKE